jgi:DNA helicase-2/ATP-dependent DNA helicase PcrA
VARRFVLRAEPADARPAALQIDYAAALDPQQLAAATAPPGPTLVVAGAGTGKTRTLVYRVAYLVETGTPPEGIALLTFTRRAAAEMLGRAARLLDGRCELVRGGTFHAFCLGVLRQHAGRLGLPAAFTLLDTADAADVVDLLRTQGGHDAAQRRFPRKGTIQALLSASVNRGLPLAEVVETTAPQFVAHTEAIAEIARAFAAYKREAGLVDYDDLLALTAELFRDHPDVEASVAGGLRHVLVDEYQDVNGLQAEVVARLASVHGNVTAVGDDAQAIYGFRGSDVAHILGFADRYPGARVLKLERNYRSTQPILDLANHVLQGVGYDKRLVAERGAGAGDLPALVRAPDDVFEARFVAQVVLDAREDGLSLGRIGVLFRSGPSSFALEAELQRRGVPFVKRGGLKLAEAAHVRDVVAHLRAAENPADAVAWTRCLKLVEGVGPQASRALLPWVAEAVATDRIDADAMPPLRSAAAASGALALARLVAALREDEAAGATVEAQTDRLLAFYRPTLDRVYPDDADVRAADLDAFAALAAGAPSRRQFLEGLALDPLDLTAGPAEGAFADEAPLVLSTIHSAKGLEFDTVFLIHALDGVLPSLYAVKSAAETDEERRLLYVALTRAETSLYVSYPLVHRRRGQGGVLTEPSRFLSGVPETLLEPWSLVQEEGPPLLGSGPDAPRLGP